MSKDPEAICQQILGSTITGIEITADDTVRITLNRGVMEFEGESLELYVEMDELNS